MNLAVVTRSYIIYNKALDTYYSYANFVEYLDDLAKHFDVTLITPVSYMAKSDSKDTIGSNITVYPLFTLSSMFVLKHILYAISLFKIISVILRHEHILIMMPSPVSCLACCVAKLFRKMAIVYLGSFWDEVLVIKYGKGFSGSVISKIGAYFEQKVMKGADIRIVTDYKMMNKYKYEPTIITKPITLFNLNDIDRKALRKKDDIIRVLYIGSVIKLKGLEYAINAISDMVKLGYRIEFHVVGESSNDNYQKKLNKIISDNNIIDNIKFYGYIKDKQVIKDICKRCDIFLLPSLEEGFPRVLYEVMTQGLPIISTNVGGIPYLLKHEENALLINSKSHTEIVTSLEKMIKSMGLKERIICNNFELVKTILDEKAGHQLSKILRAN